MDNISNKIIVILGPTASGKSDVAIKLARKFSAKGGPASGWNGAEIISADSRQIYKGMDIGSGKITKAEQKMIPHYMLDVVSPKTNYSVVKFKKKSEKIIEDILSRGKVPIICGGTGFWIKAIVDNVSFPEVKPNWVLRNKLSNKSTEELFKKLKKLDSERSKGIDRHNKVRLIRAIEICKAIGKVPKLKCHSELVSESQDKKIEIPDRVRDDRPYDFLQIGIDWPKEKLHKRIKSNVEKRFKKGMVAEVKRMKKNGVSWKRIQSFGLSYLLVPEFIKGNIKSKEGLKEKIYLAEKNYAKRQLTWFNRDKRIKWLKNYKEIEREAKNYLKNS